jgi:hypothetical protein
VSTCEHGTLREDCHTAHTRTVWWRQSDGTYDPGMTEVREETDTTFECVDCGATVALTDDARLDGEEAAA